jgi:hypothetical protein
VATPVEGDVRAVTAAQAVLPPERDGGQRAQWSDAWTLDYSAKAARAYQRAGRGETAAPDHGPFVAQRLGQEDVQDDQTEASASPLHQSGTAAYRMAQGAGTQFLRGDMGIDVHV